MAIRTHAIIVAGNFARRRAGDWGDCGAGAPLESVGNVRRQKPGDRRSCDASGLDSVGGLPLCIAISSRITFRYYFSETVASASYSAVAAALTAQAFSRAKIRYPYEMPFTNLEQRIQDRMTRSLRNRLFSFRFMTVMLAAMLIIVVFAHGDTALYLIRGVDAYPLRRPCGSAIPGRSLPRRSVVLWIRRFHRGAESRHEQQILEGAVVPWGRLITLADSNVKSAAGSRSVVWIFSFVIVSISERGLWDTTWICFPLQSLRRS